MKNIALLQSIKKGQVEKESLTEDQDLEKFFEVFDEENSEKINLNELEATLKFFGYESELPQMKSTLRNLSKGKSMLSKKDFLSLLNSKDNENISSEDVENIFQQYDFDNSGFWSKTKLRFDCSDEEMELMIKYFSKNDSVTKEDLITLI